MTGSRPVHPELREVARLARIFRAGPGVLVGIGDDCAVVRGSAGPWLLKCDPVVEGVHFPRGTPLGLAGRKAVNRSLSDIAAMGGIPRYALVSALFPGDLGPRDRTAVFRGIQTAAERAGVAVVGGDLCATPGPLTVVVFVAGSCDGVAPVTRSGAAGGDLLFVTGALGGSILGKHLRFAPRLAEGRRLARRHRPSAMLDVSDGLLLDLARILEASGGLGAVLDEAAIPVAAAAVRRARQTGRPPLAHALTDGEDHELLFALPPAHARRLARDGALPAAARQPIGEVTPEPGIRLRRRDGRTVRLRARGYEHEFGGDQDRRPR